MLQEQYRMHPAISAFPSAFFYEGALRDAPVVTSVTRAAPWHPSPGDGSAGAATGSKHSVPALPLGPWVVWDVGTGREVRRGGGSLVNIAEAELAAALVKGGCDHRSDEWCGDQT
jgi:senataxin